MHAHLKTKSRRTRRVDGIRFCVLGPGLLKRHRQANLSNAVPSRPTAAFPETGVMFKPVEFRQAQDESTQL